MIDSDHQSLSVRRQCTLLGLSRASYFYVPATETADNLKIMRWIDRQYTKTPFFGTRRLVVLLRGLGVNVNRKRISRLMQTMGLEAIYARRRVFSAGSESKVYPYLLRNLKVRRPNQVWSTDITYIPMENGFLYLAAVIDWYSRYVLSWRVSNTLDGDFCIDALHAALQQGTPDIFNTDQGSQFTSEAFTGVLKKAGVRISMDGRGRALDNIFVERLWRSVKYEDIYLKNYETGGTLSAGMKNYFSFYNRERPHQSLDYQTPSRVFNGGLITRSKHS